MVVSPAVNSLPTGVNYDQISAGGCNCHAAAPNAAVMVTLDGLPKNTTCLRPIRLQSHSLVAHLLKEMQILADSTCGHPVVKLLH